MGHLGLTNITVKKKFWKFRLNDLKFFLCKVIWIFRLLFSDFFKSKILDFADSKFSDSAEIGKFRTCSSQDTEPRLMIKTEKRYLWESSVRTYFRPPLKVKHYLLMQTGRKVKIVSVCPMRLTSRASCSADDVDGQSPQPQRWPWTAPRANLQWTSARQYFLPLDKVHTKIPGKALAIRK